MGGRYSEVHATLAVHGAHLTPVWIITYVGACQPVFGPIGTTTPPLHCGPAVRWQVDVDATTGEAYAAFGYDYDGSSEEKLLEVPTRRALS